MFRYSINFFVICYIFFSCGTWNGASYYIEVFAERYRLQFQSSDDQDESSKDPDDLSPDDDDDFQNALEELDQSSELYKEIVAAIIEDSNHSSKEISVDEKLNEIADQKVDENINEEGRIDDSEEENNSEKVPRLLEEAAVESIGKRFVSVF